MKVFIAGLLNIETNISVGKFPIDYYPIDFPFFGINSSVSGVAYNIAKALKTLGDKVNLCSFIADDYEGRMILDELKKEKINSKGIRKKLKKTPVSAIFYDDTGKRQIHCDLKDIQEHSLSDEDVDICHIAHLTGLIRTCNHVNLVEFEFLQVFFTNCVIEGYIP